MVNKCEVSEVKDVLEGDFKIALTSRLELTASGNGGLKQRY